MEVMSDYNKNIFEMVLNEIGTYMHTHFHNLRMIHNVLLVEKITEMRNI